MKTNIILIALFVAAFMFTSIRSIDTVNAETDISHCANLEATAAQPACEATAHVEPAPPTFDASIRMGAESNANMRNETSYRNELRQQNRLRNGIPGSGRKMK